MLSSWNLVTQNIAQHFALVARSRQKSSLLPLALRVVLHPPNPSKQGKQQILSASLPTAIERERERAEEKRDLLQKCHLQARSPIGKAHRWRGSVPLTALTHPPLDSSNEQQQQHHHHTLLTLLLLLPLRCGSRPCRRRCRSNGGFQPS